MTTMEGRCDICGKKVVVEIIDDKTEYLDWSDQIKEGCRHYPEAEFLSSSDKPKLELELSEYEKKQREFHQAYLEDILKSTEFDIEEVKKEAEEIFEEIKNGNWEKFVRLQLEGAMKKQVGKNPYSKKNAILKSMVIDLLIEKEFIKERGETKQTIYIVTANDFSSLMNDGGYLERPIFVEYGFSSKIDAWAYYLDQKKIRRELGLDYSELGVYEERKTEPLKIFIEFWRKYKEKRTG